MNILDYARKLGVSDAAASKVSAFELDFAVSIVLKLSDVIINQIDEAPTYSYFHHYRTVNAFIDRTLFLMGLEIEKQGYLYFPVAASQTVGGNRSFKGVFSHKEAAVKAGLGYIGKSGLFISKDFGARVRLGTIFTNMPLKTAESILPQDCGSCDCCVKACPAKCINEKSFDRNLPNADLMDRGACSEYMKKYFQHIGRGAVCGICMKVCPK